MMENYSRRTLTFDKDKLAAVAGIVEEFKGLIYDTPTMGLWQGDILTGLLWRTAEPARRIDCLGVMPSWSWTSVSGPVNWEHLVSAPSRSPKNQLEVISVNIDWSGRPMTSQVLDAKLKVRGRLKNAKLSGWETRGNSLYLPEIDESVKDSLEPSEARTVKQTLAAQEVLGYCYWTSRSSSIRMFGVWKSTPSPGSRSPTDLEVAFTKSLFWYLLMTILANLGGWELAMCGCNRSVTTGVWGLR
jgi:hypothetical protein